MAERDASERLDAMIDAIVAGRAVPVIDGDLAALALVAADLRDLPDPRFRERLRNEFVPKEDDMTTAIAPETTTTHIRPYFIVDGAKHLIDFLVNVFDAEVLGVVPAPGDTVMHAEVRVGDSIIEMGDTGGRFTPRTPPMHVYIENVDDAYRRALAAGATSIYPPTEQYGDREAGVVDRFGTQWFIATHLEDGPRRKGYGTVTCGFRVAGADRMIAFLEQAYGAVEVDRTTGPSGEIRHAELKLGQSMVEVGEAHGDWGPTTGAFHFYVDDCDAVYERALRAGATSVEPPQQKPYGERSAAVDDPFGNQWYIATPTS